MASRSRTLVKSQPELWDMLDQRERMHGLISALLGRAAEFEVTAREPGRHLAWQAAVEHEVAAIQIALEEKGFGTRVEIVASVEPERDGVDDWLEALFEELASPERRPFEGIG